jgi:linoleate 10R-lipoxygenase
LDWNKDAAVAVSSPSFSCFGSHFLPFPEAAAEALYHDIDNLELYVGLQAEQAKEPRPGAGLCPGFTISRAILSDAVALTRGDRFMTIDHTRM